MSDIFHRPLANKFLDQSLPISTQKYIQCKSTLYLKHKSQPILSFSFQKCQTPAILRKTNLIKSFIKKYGCVFFCSWKTCDLRNSYYSRLQLNLKNHVIFVAILIRKKSEWKWVIWGKIFSFNIPYLLQLTILGGKLVFKYVCFIRSET